MQLTVQFFFWWCFKHGVLIVVCNTADALSSLRKASPGVCPNYGFMEQVIFSTVAPVLRELENLRFEFLCRVDVCVLIMGRFSCMMTLKFMLVLVGMPQLAIFENMGNRIDRDSPFYKKWKVGVFGEVPVLSVRPPVLCDQVHMFLKLFLPTTLSYSELVL